MQDYKQTESIGFLNPTKYQIMIMKLPRINFTVQDFTLPGLYTTPTDMETPFSTLRFSGDKFIYAPLNFTFKVEDNFKNYYSIYNWIKGVGFPIDFSEAQNITSKNQKSLDASGDGRYSDVVLMVYNEQNIISNKIIFYNACPIALGDVTFSSKEENKVNYRNCSVTFSYDYFDFDMDENLDLNS